MEHKIIVLLISVMFLSGCGLFNLNGWIVPDDLEFLEVVESLKTPKMICAYMEDNFEWVLHFTSYSPYQMWLANMKTKVGDCNDMVCFAIFIAHYHGYEIYQIRVRETFFRYHLLGVFVENGGYTSSSNTAYYSWVCESFKDIVKIHYGNNYISYKVYDYEMNLIEVGNGR